MKLSQTTEGAERPLEVPWSGEVLKLRYVPERLSAGDASRLDEAFTAVNLAWTLAKVITWWDVEEPELAAPAEGEEPQPTGQLVHVEPTEANLLRTGIRFLGAIYKAIQEDNTPSEKASGSFASG